MLLAAGAAASQPAPLRAQAAAPAPASPVPVPTSPPPPDSPALPGTISPDADLRELIPDNAVADPEAWAGASGDASVAETPAGRVDPTAPLAELPGMTLPWPDATEPVPVLAALPPDPDLAAEGTTAVTLPESTVASGEEIKVSGHLTLVFPPRLQTFPERATFIDRFSALSTLLKYDNKEATFAQVAARARADRELIAQLLRIYGYYDALVTQTVGKGDLTAAEVGTDVMVRFDVEPGPRFRFGAIALGQLDRAGPDAVGFRQTFAIASGDPLDNDRIVAQRSALDTALGETGYAFAKVGEPDLLVDHKRREGDLTVPVDPGGKYRFGPLISQQPRFLSSQHIADIARFKPGELYQRTRQEDLRRAILATGLVASVTVTPRESSAPAAPGQTGEVAMDVAMVPGPQRTIAGLVGYETGNGFRLEGSWEHRNFFPPEGMLRLRGVAGTLEQLAGTTVRWNNWHGRDQVLTLDVYANTVQRDAYTARTLAFTGSFEKLTTLLFQKPWIWSAGVEILATQERESAVGGQSVPRNTFFIAALPVRGALDYSDNLLDPTRGWRGALRISPEISKQQNGPTVNYARIQFDLSGYKAVGSRLVLAARGRVGSIPGTPLANIAPSRRFYAGGGGSVRGYGFQEIGPRNNAGDPSGGRSLVELSVEARIGTGLLDGAVEVVPFLDAGTVAESIRPTLTGLRYGAGLGLRYKSGFGPIRLDLGTPLNPRPGDSRVTVSVALGQAF
ncbi:autotransporter assembly complex family protein [Novosphingobium piscinae]|uniref:BamA/TamA family outer membrane protein n=1 Tax=Novosphingobium piscinae TaxID=1507448 RepID=A0A7X1FWK1_9SPHN|nr:BamA/TamA family outer membrane protein [Novosphingobium piscinae]MBC2668299.1 BamA/TamA family outer membrane protein [Novosphingobium piscinae]